MSLASAMNMAGVAGSRPAASIAGRLYFATDTGQLSYDNGASWANINGTGPRGELGYVQVTTSQTTTSTTAVDLTSLTLTVTATARSLQITAYCGNLRHSVDGSQTTLEIYDTTGTAVVSDGTITAAAAGTGGPCCVVARVAPGAGSRSYKARFYADTAGTATFTAAATEPGFLLICEL